MHAFTAVLKTAGAQFLQARDAGTTFSPWSSSAAVMVTPATARTLNVAGGGGFIGSAHTVTVTAQDIYGNVDVNDAGTVHLASSDPRTVVSADAALVNGVATFQVTPMALGVQTLTATDAAGVLPAGTESVTVTPGWAVRLTATPLANAAAGATQAMTVTAYDAFGDVSTVYTGTVVVSSSDAQAGVSYYAFTTADAGVHTFGVSLKTAGPQSVRVADAADATVAASQSGIVVTPAAAVSMSVTPLHPVTAGAAQAITVALRDAYGNLAAGYRGTVAFGSSDTQAALPAAYTFTAADAGTRTFSVTLKSSGGQTFAVADAANAALAGSQRDLQVYAGAVAGFVLRAPDQRHRRDGLQRHGVGGGRLRQRGGRVRRHGTLHDRGQGVRRAARLHVHRRRQGGPYLPGHLELDGRADVRGRRHPQRPHVHRQRERNVRVRAARRRRRRRRRQDHAARLAPGLAARFAPGVSPGLAARLAPGVAARSAEGRRGRQESCRLRRR